MTPWERVPGTASSGGERARRAATLLAEGAVLAHPTETVYGLGGGTAAADGRIRRMKGRAADRPFLRLAADVASLREHHPELVWSDAASRLAEALWPGPLTLVLDDGSARGLGVRVEAHPLTRGMLVEWGGTMSSTSLNRSGERPAATAAAARRALDALAAEGEESVWWLDAGDLPGGPPSTLVSLRHDPPRLLRAGAVPPDRVEELLGRELARG